MTVLGIDIGGTKTAVGLVSASGQVTAYHRAPTPHVIDAITLFTFIVNLAEQALAASTTRPTAIGVGCGGPMHYPAGIVSPLHIPAWRDFPLQTKLAAHFRLPVIVDNDAKALALGEARFGAGEGARALLGMVVSTGVGGGIVIDGQLQHGATGNAGHIGHVIVSPRGPRCDCGAHGCLTAFTSGTGLAARAIAALRRGTSSTLATLPSEEVTAAAIATAATAGDRLARTLLRDAGLSLGRAIASAAVLLDLDRVVIGGGVAESGDLLFQPLHQELRRRARLSFTDNLTILPAALGPAAGVIGAGTLALATFTERIQA